MTHLTQNIGTRLIQEKKVVTILAEHQVTILSKETTQTNKAATPDKVRFCNTVISRQTRQPIIICPYVLDSPCAIALTTIGASRVD